MAFFERLGFSREHCIEAEVLEPTSQLATEIALALHRQARNRRREAAHSSQLIITEVRIVE